MNPNFSPSFLQALGIPQWGYTEESKPQSFQHFSSWLKKNHDQPLKYLKNEKALMREDVKNYFPQFQSALVFLFDYTQAKKDLLEVDNSLKIASYVLGFEGEDYHSIVRDRLQKIADELLKNDPELIIKFSLDTQPVLERDLAYRAGLGWFGKNSMLINREQGSYFIIGSLLLSKKLDCEIKALETDHCGQCRKCIDACPTDAINPENRTIVTDKCLSTFTIELFKESNPPDLRTKHTNEFYGCDICQEVCPWNDKPLDKLIAKPVASNTITDFFFRPIEKIKKDLEGLSNNQFRKIFAKTPLARTGRIGLLKNLKLFNE